VSGPLVAVAGALGVLAAAWVCRAVRRAWAGHVLRVRTVAEREYRAWRAYVAAMLADERQWVSLETAAGMVGRRAATVRGWVARGTLHPDPTGRVLAQEVMRAQHGPRRAAG
jgi:hypothetical protein